MLLWSLAIAVLAAATVVALTYPLVRSVSFSGSAGTYACGPNVEFGCPGYQRDLVESFPIGAHVALAWTSESGEPVDFAIWPTPSTDSPLCGSVGRGATCGFVAHGGSYDFHPLPGFEPGNSSIVLEVVEIQGSYSSPIVWIR